MAHTVARYASASPPTLPLALVLLALACTVCCASADAPVQAPEALSTSGNAPEPGADDAYDIVMAVDASAEEGDLRLARRTDVGNGFVAGALQVFIGGVFGAICSRGFEAAEADVACRQMGFPGGVQTSVFTFFTFDLERDEDIAAPIVLENLNCTGSEERLVDCPGVAEAFGSNEYEYLYSFVGGACQASRGTYAYVVCGTLSGPEEEEIRLAPVQQGASDDPDSNAVYGLLEVFSLGGWASARLCDRINPPSPVLGGAGLSEAAASVACRQLGFAGGELAVTGGVSDVALQSDFLGDSFPAVQVPLLSGGDVPVCFGSEGSLAECQRSPPGVTTAAECRLFNPSVTGLVCYRTFPPESGMDGELRLAEGQAGPGYEYGRLDIFLRGLWRAVCDRDFLGFDAEAANVACSALGYHAGTVLGFPQARKPVLASTLPVGLSKVACAGNETAESLLQCSAASTYGDISERRNSRCLEVSTFGNVTVTDSTVLACANSLNTTGSCPEPTPVQGAVRLRGGVGTPCDPLHSGLVEIFNDGEWGGICSRFSGSATGALEAGVICRQLGFAYGSAATVAGQRGPVIASAGSTPADQAPLERFWLTLSQIRCLGVEEKLSDCEFGPGFREDNSGCRSTAIPRPIRQAVACRNFAVPEALEAVTTPGAAEGDVRLADQETVENWRIGRLELFFEGSWGQVCAAAFTGPDANVACRQLGFSGGAVVPNAVPGTFRKRRRIFSGTPSGMPPEPLVYPEVVLSGSPGCTGSEETISECLDNANADDLGDRPSMCFGFDSPGLEIACVAESEPGEEGALRLTDFGDGDNDPAAGFGVLEIFHAGAWGTLCNGDPDPPKLEYLDPYYDYGAPDLALLEEAAQVACRQLGFTGGEFRGIERVPADLPPLRPSWLSDLPCTNGSEATVADCGALAFGNTSSCGFPQRLLCSEGAENVPRFTPRLVDGEADPGGAWAYGRLEVFDGLDFVAVSDDQGQQELSRQGVIVACRTLGFATGGQPLAGLESALPLAEGFARDASVGRFECNGDERTLADCEIPQADFQFYGYDNYVRSEEANMVALVCFNPSGCFVADAAPAQGDIRLVALPDPGAGTPTQPCDDVHLGAVEFFNAGEWGTICGTGDRWAVDARVVCRQLGFPFGSLLDNSNTFFTGREFDDGPVAGTVEKTWATNVLCKGTEERLSDCVFPEDEGSADVLGGSKIDELGSCSDEAVLSVLCRRFPMQESDVVG